MKLDNKKLVPLVILLLLAIAAALISYQGDHLPPRQQEQEQEINKLISSATISQQVISEIIPTTTTTTTSTTSNENTQTSLEEEAAVTFKPTKKASFPSPLTRSGKRPEFILKNQRKQSRTTKNTTTVDRKTRITAPIKPEIKKKQQQQQSRTTKNTTNTTSTVNTRTKSTASKVKLSPSQLQQPRESVLDLADFPPLDIRIASSSTTKPANTGEDIINLINKNLFTKSMLFGKPQHLAENNNNNNNNNTILPWLPFHPVSCCRRSTILCDVARGVGGPLRFGYQNFTRNGHCCGLASRGKFSHPFSSDIFQTLSDSLSNIDNNNKNKNNKNKNKNNKNNKNNNKLNIKKIIGRIFPIAEDLEDEKKMYHLLSKIGETSSSQDFLETIFSGLGKDRISLKDAALSLLLGISQLKPVDIEVVVTNKNNKTIIQKAPRILLHGNSYIRALISNIAALFRGQHRYFDRGSHLAIRYTVTTHGDYYWMANEVKKESDPHSPNATKPLLEKVVLRNSNEDEEEVVLLDIVYFFQRALGYDGVKKKFGPRLASQYVAFRGSFSAIFMRFLLYRDFLDFLGGRSGGNNSAHVALLKRWTQFHIEEYFSPNSVSPQEGEAEDSPQHYFVAVPIAPIQQIAFTDGSKSLVNAATREKLYLDFVHRYLKPFFERGRDNRTIKRHVMLMPPEPNTFNILDINRHSQCILLPHFPAKATQFRSRDKNLEKCVDMLSRNFWTQFGISSFLTAKSTREYFRKLL